MSTKMELKNKGIRNEFETKQGSESCMAAEKVKEKKDAKYIRIRHIQCENFRTIQEALGQLGAGERFSEVATTYSEVRARQGGDLGWKKRGTLPGILEDVAFGLPISDPDAPIYTEPPIKTESGYHVIMVEGKK